MRRRHPVSPRIPVAAAANMPFTLRPMSAAIACAFLSIGGGVLGRAEAAPTGGQVVGGAATIQQPNSQTTLINQTTARAALNWTSFGIGAGESVIFRQPSATSVA